ncbi:unnamed protein product [Rotaria magnacalcarata]|nr:unnamed protein product [Rotaria magnacalcarata]
MSSYSEPQVTGINEDEYENEEFLARFDRFQIIEMTQRGVDVQNKLLETNYSTPIGEDATKPRTTVKTNIEMMDLTTPKTSPVGPYQPNYLP